MTADSASVPLILGHRGARHAHPDNSLAAFEAAIAEGADGVECDVQCSADGTVVLRHDFFLAADRPVSGTSLAALRAADPALLTLSELLTWRAGLGRRCMLLVELRDPQAAVAVARRLADEPPSTTWLGALHAPALAAARTAAPDLHTSLMMASVLAIPDLAAMAAAYGCRGVHPCWENRAASPSTLLTAADVAALRRTGLFLTLWHEERPAELSRLFALAPDAVCTDTPARALAVRDRR